MVLRQHGGDVYDQWVTHEIPFNDPKIVEAMQTVLDLWSRGQRVRQRRQHRRDQLR